jgi:hypothetical protein
MLVVEVGFTYAQDEQPASPLFPSTTQPAPASSTQETNTEWGWVQLAPDSAPQYLPTTRVVLTQKVVGKVVWDRVSPQSTVQSGGLSMTMERWLSATPSYNIWGQINGYSVRAGGSTSTNVTAAQLHLKVLWTWQGAGCPNGVYWYQPADAYNTTNLSSQTPSQFFGPGNTHCVKNGEHGAKFPGYNYWHWYFTGQTGPSYTW